MSDTAKQGHSRRFSMTSPYLFDSRLSGYRYICFILVGDRERLCWPRFTVEGFAGGTVGLPQASSCGRQTHFTLHSSDIRQKPRMRQQESFGYAVAFTRFIYLSQVHKPTLGGI